MKEAIMQNYLSTHTVYCYLIDSVDAFLIYNVQSILKKVCINRNRICNGEFFSVTAKKASD